MKICTTTKKFSGGVMVIPLLLGYVTNTFIPQVSEIGGFTTGLLKDGASALVGLFILCSGATINFKQAGMLLYKGVAPTALKYIIDVLIGWGLSRVFGPTGILGLTSLAVIMVATNSNGVIYIILAKEFGGSMDVGAITILSLNGGSLPTMIALDATGLAEIPLISIIVVIVPLFIGMFLGNADEEFKMLLISGLAILLPFNGLVLGANMSLMSIVKAGAGGIVLGLVTTVCADVLTYYIYSAIRRKPDPMGMAIGTTGGNAVVVPASVATADPPLNPVVGVATVQAAISAVVSVILTPLLTGYFYKKAQKKQAETSGKQGAGLWNDY